MSRLRAVKGMNDILPLDGPIAPIESWHRLENAYRQCVERYGFREIRPPLVEHTEVFIRSIGEVTDIVEKEMYTFEDRGGKMLTLRPEGTAGCARAYIQHSRQSLEPVSKWYYLGPMYRREAAQRGRYRQFYQAGCEVYGDSGPYIDAELIDMLVNYLREIGVQDIEVLINSLGDGDTRTAYRDALLSFLRPRSQNLSAESQRRLEQNPLRILDSKSPQDQESTQDAPRIVDYLSAEDKAHFEALQQTLNDLGTPYRVEPRLVRGLDYYTRTLFEIRGRGGNLGAQNTLCGGGRYDHMIRQLGGPKIPAIGFAMGLERLLLVADAPCAPSTLQAFIVTAPGFESHAVSLAKTLRQGGVRVDSDLRGNSIKSQMRRANKSGANYAVILGPHEVETGAVQLKDMRENAETKQREVSREELINELK